MKNLEELFKDYMNNELDIYEYFRTGDMFDINIGSINDDYWFLNDDTLYWCKTKEGFKTGDYYCTEDTCDERVYGSWIKDNYIGIRIGCGEHYDGKFEIFKLENKLTEEEFEDIY